MPFKLPRLLRRTPAFSRNAVRHATLIDCELLLTDSGVGYPGRLIDISTGGAMFRPRLAYLLNRRGTPARLVIDALGIDAHIVATTPAGFGLRFDAPLDDGAMRSLVVNPSRAATA
ncbi:MAG: PilZ domain-containing protein [Sphingomonadales bacterium]|nr:PilZ domain-containing protein [Sphingomonadales bacterium]